MDETRQRATYVHVVVHEQVLPADYKALHGGVDMAAEHAWLGIRQPLPSGQTLGGAKSAIMCAHPQRTTNGGSPVGAVPIMWTGQDAGLIRSKSGTHMPIRRYHTQQGIYAYHPRRDSGNQTLEYASAYGLCELSIRPDRIGEASSANT